MKKVKFKRIDILVLSILLIIVFYVFYRINIYIDYHWQWHRVVDYIINKDENGYHFGLLSKGLFYTLKLSLWSIIFSIILGFIFGTFRSFKRPFFRFGSLVYVEVNRNIPPLILIFIFYFFISDQIFTLLEVEYFIRNLGETTREIISIFFAPPNLISSFFAGVLALSVFESAYIAEIVKAGIESVDVGQKEAAKALGLSKYQVLRYIIIPQASKVIIPPLSNQCISTIKDSSIVSVIAIPELTFQGMEMMSATYLSYETWITVTFFYFILTFSLSLLNKRIEKTYTLNF
ncbi:amino acid ABC transporter permease [Deferribacteraceae bacterium V6Fe1]|nr:amino acid ABC transporter permease [Deferribacteraceae bacterium V6Fe1]